jgi:hypothetical protein
LGAATAAGSAAAAGGLGEAADPLGAMPFNPAMTAMAQALGEATAAAVSTPALDSGGSTTASEVGTLAGTAAPGTEIAALPAATGDAATGGSQSSDASDPQAAGSSSRGWLLAIVIGVALVGGWLAYRRRAGSGLHAE